MAAAYTKEFLVNVFVHRFRNLNQDKIDSMRTMADAFYDDVGRDKFRVYASLPPDVIKEYKLWLK